MSWTVGVLENTLELNDACKAALIENKNFQYLHLDQEAETEEDKENLRDYGFDGNNLYLSSDWCEHIDILGSNPEFVDIIKAHGCTGDVCFGSMEGDNSGSFWGYRFKDGQCIELTGSVVFQEN